MWAPIICALFEYVHPWGGKKDLSKSQIAKSYIHFFDL
jgi:hypothetical protein